MTQVQFGFNVPIGNFNPNLSRQEFLSRIRTALDTIAGHFDSVWIADHLQFGDRPLCAGWAEEEARAYHLPFPDPGPRVSEFEEQLQIINALWREENVTFEGKYHQVTNANCLPHPDPIPPVLIAGTKPRMMRIAARYGDWWN